MWLRSLLQVPAGVAAGEVGRALGTNTAATAVAVAGIVAPATAGRARMAAGGE